MAQPLDTKKLYADVYKIDGHNYGSFGEAQSQTRATNPQIDVIKRYIIKYAPSSNSLVTEIGCGLGHLNSCHPNGHGYEYSSTAVDLAKKTYGQGLKISEADARDLPIASNSVDFLFSFAALEHIPELERAFLEIERVLKPNGIAVLSPAWNCRSWTVKKLQQRPFSELSSSEKLGKLLIPLRNSLIFRMACSIPSRLNRELLLLATEGPIELQYQILSPDFSLWNRYEHISDDDAFVNIDAHSALAYFSSRKWICESHPNLFRRFIYRGEEIVVRKVGAGGG